MQNARTVHVVCFGPFKLDLKGGELQKDGLKILLQEQPFQVLRLLIENPGEVVTREEIRRRLWPNDTVVEFDHSINATVKKLRQALGDSAESPRYIETLARRGYRFLAPVAYLEAQASNEKSAQVWVAQTPGPAQGNLIGRRVSHYRVLEVLGGGGMGVVYKAEDIKLGRRVALKFLPEELANDPAAMGRFEREARAASALNHPNICTIYEVEEHEGCSFIVMELLEGQTLRDRIASQMQFPADQLLDLAIQITDALGAAHQRGIIHRDIKPANIFITTQRQAKILDFGLAKLQESEFQDVHPPIAAVGQAEQEQNPNFTLTRTGVAIGTAGYMSPEQLRGEKLDVRTDLFSFGLVLYEMAAGARAFTGETAPILHDAILNQTPTPVRELNSAISPKLEKIINRALEKDRERRYQSTADLRADLEATRRKAPARRGRTLEAAVAGVLLLAVVGAVFWVVRRQPPSLFGLPELKQRQLTSNSSENAVSGGAISRNGKYLAYADPSGIHIKLLETGETQTIPQPEAMKGKRVEWGIVPMWVSDTKFLANATVPGDHPSIWIVSTMAVAPRKLRDDSLAWSVSWDGSMVAFGKNLDRFGDREIWLMRTDGEQVRKLGEVEPNTSIMRAEWSPDDRRIAYIKVGWGHPKFEINVESRDLKGGPAVTMLSEPKLWDFYWLPGGRIIYSLAEPDPNGTSCNYWEATVDARARKPLTKPRRLTAWAGFCMCDMSASKNGKQFAFRRWNNQENVIIAELENNSTRIAVPRRLTVTEGEDYPVGWTSDGRAVIFASHQNGQYGVFKQRLDEDAVESLVTEPGDTTDPRVSPDGQWVLYQALEKQGGSSAPIRLMRVSMRGGRSQLVFAAPARLNSLACAKSPATICAIAEWTPDAKHLIFTAIDPLKGRVGKLTEFDVDPSAQYSWDLSADGTRLAIVKRPDDRIHIVAFDTQARRDVIVKDWNNFVSVVWAVDGQGLFASSLMNGSSVLLYLDLRSNPSILWQQKGAGSGVPVYAVPSPDGRHLAIHSSTVNSNIWMMENF